MNYQREVSEITLQLFDQIVTDYGPESMAHDVISVQVRPSLKEANDHSTKALLKAIETVQLYVFQEEALK